VPQETQNNYALLQVLEAAKMRRVSQAEFGHRQVGHSAFELRKVVQMEQQVFSTSQLGMRERAVVRAQCFCGLEMPKAAPAAASVLSSEGLLLHQVGVLFCRQVNLAHVRFGTMLPEFRGAPRRYAQRLL
jgi:hypothetical protein